MFETLSVTGMIFALIGLGYIVARAGIFGSQGVQALGAYVVNLALPALIFRTVAARDLSEIVSVGYLAGYAAGSLATLGIGYLWSRRVGRLPGTQSIFRAMGMSCANSGFIGYPIVLMILPEVAGPALALTMIVENLLMIPVILLAAEAGRSRGGRVVRALGLFVRLARNPILLGIAAGMAVSISGLAMPPVVERTVGLLAGSSAAVSLVAIGAMLATLSAGRGALAGVASVVVGKLLLHPALVGLALLVASALGLGVGGDLLRAGIVFAAVPAMSIYPVLAGQYGQGRVAAVAMLAMTVASFGTVNALLGLLDRLPV